MEVTLRQRIAPALTTMRGTPLVAQGAAVPGVVSAGDAADRSGEVVVDLLRLNGTGPVWGMASSDLNATLLVWPPATS